MGPNKAIHCITQIFCCVHMYPHEIGEARAAVMIKQIPATCMDWKPDLLLYDQNLSCSSFTCQLKTSDVVKMLACCAGDPAFNVQADNPKYSKELNQLNPSWM